VRERSVSAELAGIGALAHRELLSLFVTPVAYVVGTLFLLLQGWNFALLLRVLNDPLAAPGPVMQFYFGGSFFIFWLPVLFLCAALSMRLVAEERKQGTLEALMTAPLRPVQVVLGKFAGALSFYVLLWLPTSVFYVLLRGARVAPDLGPIASGYLGTFMVGASFVAVGLLASALSKSQLGAAVSTFVTCTILLLAGLLVDQVDSAPLAMLIERTSLLSMMQELAQGIVDGRWVWMHLGIVATALFAAVVAIDPRRDLQRWIQLGLFALVAVHVTWFGFRHAERRDWTAGRVYSLSDRAREILSSLEERVDVRVVVPSTIGAGRPNPLAQELREVLTRMTAASPKLRVRFIDPDRDRQEAEQLVADWGLGGRDLADGVVLVRAGQGANLRKHHLWPNDLVVYATGADVQATGPRVKEFRGEEALLGAFVRVSDPVDLSVCVTQGHGEPRIDNLEPFAGYAHLRDLLVNAHIDVRVAALDGSAELGECDVLLVAGPSGLLPRKHVEAIERYAEAGGDLLVLSGAVIVPGATELAQHGLEPLLSRYGVRLGNRVVLDPHEMPGAAPLLAFTIDDGWGEHRSVRSLVGRAISFILVREILLQPAEESRAEILVEVGEQAWAEADIAGLRAGEPPVFDDAEDRRGPIPVAVAAERGGSRMVVVASDQFALNAYLRDDVAYDHGRDLVLNAIGWLTDRDVLLGIRPREREHVKLVLMPEQLQRMTLVCLIGLPGFGIALGLLVLWRRRR
jgi:ABC-2 type transport system permease protein